MIGPRYAELQVTSHFSFLRGASSCEELFAQASLLGIEALAIVDGRDPREGPPRDLHTHDIYIPDLHLDTVEVKSRNFR